MGMTIEENIATLKEHLNTLNADKGVEFYQEIESIQSAIDTMHKYQKIEEIVEHWACGGNPSDSMIAISEVLEDGNDD